MSAANEVDLNNHVTGRLYKGYRLVNHGYYPPNRCVWWQAENLKTNEADFSAHTMRDLKAQIESSKRGFTLIEMMVVFAIIAILIALIQPRYQRSLETSRQTLVLSNLNALADAAERYYLDNGTNTVLTSDLVGPNLYINRLDPVSNEIYPTTITTGTPISTTGSPALSIPF